MFKIVSKDCFFVGKKCFVPSNALVRPFSTSDVIERRLLVILKSNGGPLMLSQLRAQYESKFDRLNYDGKLSTFLRAMNWLHVEGSLCSVKEGVASPATRKVTLLSRLAQIEPLIEQKDWLCEEDTVAIDCEGVPDGLHMLQIATDSDVYVFDSFLLGPENVGKCIESVLASGKVTKLFHDLHCDAAALQTFANVQPTNVSGTLDTQLVMEYLTSEIDHGLNSMLRFFGLEENEEKKQVTAETREEFYKGMKERPIKNWALNYAAQDVSCLHEASAEIGTNIDPNAMSLLKQASDERYRNAARCNGQRRVRFDPKTSRMMSTELLAVIHNDRDSTVPLAKVHSESDSLLEMLPAALRESISEHMGHGDSSFNEVVVDIGRPPVVFSNSGRTVLPASTLCDVDAISQQFSFDETGRACLEKKLHRISVLRNRKDEPVGLTFRTGRYIEDYAAPLRDLLFEDPTKSILVIGPPSSGKTSLIRDIARMLSEEFHTCVVDGNNEIAGDGNVPHHCIGFARRVMTKQRSMQADAMIECVLNHSPEVIVIDEIGSYSEANAAISCGRRGVRIVASAHGSLDGLVQNPTLNLLVGGVESVILSDSTVVGKDDAGRDQLRQGRSKKHRLERVAQPVFPLIVELKRGSPGEFWVTKDATKAVDKIILGKSHRTEHRLRDDKTGDIILTFSR